MKSGIRKTVGMALFGATAMTLHAADGLAATHDSKVAVLYRFSGGDDGGEPLGPLIADPAGNLYGTTAIGGSAAAGVVFELSQSGGVWAEAVLHTFTGPDGANPNGGLKIDKRGNLYGTTFSGTGDHDGGTVFRLSPSGGGGAWAFSLLNSFGSTISRYGSVPNGSPVHRAGGLYDTTQIGGGNVCEPWGVPCGTVFALAATHRQTWPESVIYSFAGPPDGAFPYAGLVSDKSGTLYGTTNMGGSGDCRSGELVLGCGTVFALAPSKNGWSETTLYAFGKSEQNGPYAPVAFGRSGDLYGTAGGDVFHLMPPKAGAKDWTKETLYEFPGGNKGTSPSSGVAFDRKGNIYGTTQSSGSEGYSSVFELSPPGKGGVAWTETTLAKFGKGAKLNQPLGGVLIGKNGTLYGAVAGEKGYVFAITP